MTDRRRAAAGHRLPDLLAPGLRLVICGSAAGAVSARRGAYYAGPGNRFWEILHATRLTPRRLQPHEFACLLQWGIGLTDMAKAYAGPDAGIGRGDDDAAALAAKVRAVAPAVLAFNGKRAARALLRRPVAAGAQPERIESTRLWVLPSTSAAARRWWDEAPWFALAALPELRRRS